MTDSNDEIQLHFLDDSRLWLRGDGWERLHDFLWDSCLDIYSLGNFISIGDAPWGVYINTKTGRAFEAHASELFPPDGYSGVFIRTKFGGPGWRSIEVMSGEIVHDADHPRTAADEAYPRRRPSRLLSRWGCELTMQFNNGKPSSRFTIDLNADVFKMDHLGGGPDVDGLFKHLNLEPVTRVDIANMPSFRELLQLQTLSKRSSFLSTKPTPSPAIPYDFSQSLGPEHSYLGPTLFSQRFDPATGRWRGFVKAVRIAGAQRVDENVFVEI